MTIIRSKTVNNGESIEEWPKIPFQDFPAGHYVVGPDPDFPGKVAWIFSDQAHGAGSEISPDP